MRPSATVLLTLVLLAGCNRMKKETSDQAAELERKIARFAPTEIKADLGKLGEADRKALDKIVEAARHLDPLYLRQVWHGNADLLRRLEADRTPAGQARLRYFRINFGPWSRLDQDEPFVPGVPAKPPQAGFYPDDMTKEEFNAWVGTLKGEAAASSTSSAGERTASSVRSPTAKSIGSSWSLRRMPCARRPR